jgi:hypothetical protein
MQTTSDVPGITLPTLPAPRVLTSPLEITFTATSPEFLVRGGLGRRLSSFARTPHTCSGVIKWGHSFSGRPKCVRDFRVFEVFDKTDDR